MNTERIRGIITPIITPTCADESIDLAAAQRLIDYIVEGGVQGVFLFGTTGEPYGFSFEEKKRFIERSLEAVNGRVPLYVGTGAITTREAIRLTKMAEDCGADAVSVVTPFFSSPNQDELYDYYRDIAESTKLPVILYNNAPRTKVSIAAKTLKRLSEIDNIVGVKDSTGDMTLTNEYINATIDRNFRVLMGRDTLIHAGLMCGAKGAIAACSNVAPRLCSDIYDRYIAGDLAGSAQAQRDLAPLRLAFSLGTFPEIIREALRCVGIETGCCLKPVGRLSDADRETVRRIIKEMGLVK